MAKMTVKSTFPAGKCTKFPRICGTFPEGVTQNVHHAPVPSPEIQVFLARRYWLLLALTGSYWLLLSLGPPETHPMSIQTFHKSLIVNKLPKHTLCLGTSESTQRQPRFCNLLIIKRPKTERWLWGGKYAGKLLFRSRRLECGEKSAGKNKFSFLRYLARQSFVRTLFLWPFRKRKCLVLKKVYLI